MIKKMLPFLFLVFALAGCKSRSAFNYSEDFVKKEQSLIPDINQTESSIKTFLANAQFDSIAAAGSAMEKKLDKALEDIKANPAPDVKGGNEFKAACIKYFAYIKSMYTGYKHYGNASTPEARDAELEKLRSIVEGKTAAIADIQQAQSQYAKLNGIKMENK